MATNNATNTSNPITVAQGGTGDATITGVLTGNGTGVITGNAVTQFAPVVGGASNAVGSIAVGSAGQVLQSGGNAANPVYSTATYPATTTINQLLYSSSGNVVGGLTTANSGVLSTNSSGVPSIDTTNFHVLTTGVQVKGNNTNTAPPAGFIGEQLTNSAGSISIATTTTQNLGTITVTPGVWDISGMADLGIASGAVTISTYRLGISTTSATMPGTAGINQLSTPVSPTASSNIGISLPAQRYTIATNTSVYLVATATYSGGGTASASGYITATRVG